MSCERRLCTVFARALRPRRCARPLELTHRSFGAAKSDRRLLRVHHGQGSQERNASDQLHGVVVKHKRRSPLARGSRIHVGFSLAVGCDPAAVAENMMAQIGHRHRWASLTCFVHAARPVALRWDIRKKKVQTVPVPDMNLSLSACFVSGTGQVLVALTSGPKDESLVRTFLVKSGRQEDVADELKVLGLEHTRTSPTSVLQPNMLRDSISAFRVKGQTVWLQACIPGVNQLQNLRLRPCIRIKGGGGYIMAVDGGFPWQPASTQLQLVCDDVVVDRYDLSADDIRAIQRDVNGAVL